MGLSKVPIIGALANVCIFGAADLYVGNWRRGMISFVLMYITLYVIGAILSNIADKIWGGCGVWAIQFLLGWSYVIFAALYGYRVVQKQNTHISEAER